MRCPQGLEHAIKVDGDYELTGASGDTWREPCVGVDYYVEPSGQITEVSYKGILYPRRPETNFKSETGRRVVTLEEVPERFRPQIRDALQNSKNK